jgi:hypothetical protein
MIDFKRAEKIFLSVRRKLWRMSAVAEAKNLMYKKPWSFYRKNGVKRSVEILLKEADDMIKGLK